MANNVFALTPIQRIAVRGKQKKHLDASFDSGSNITWLGEHLPKKPVGEGLQFGSQ